MKCFFLLIFYFILFRFFFRTFKNFYQLLIVIWIFKEKWAQNNTRQKQNTMKLNKSQVESLIKFFSNVKKLLKNFSHSFDTHYNRTNKKIKWSNYWLNKNSFISNKVKSLMKKSTRNWKNKLILISLWSMD